MEEDKSIYNIVTIKNIDNEDFVFAVDKVQYIIKAGEVRNFPKFMARLAVKHLVDKVLLKEDQNGSLLGNSDKRAEVSGKIVIEEQTYERPRVPTDQEIVDDINRPTDIDSALNRQPAEVKQTVGDRPLEEDPEDNPIQEEKEKFDEIEKEKEKKGKGELPPREEMLDYATNTLKMDLDNKIKIGSKMVTLKEFYGKMTDEALYDELQMGV